MLADVVVRSGHSSWDNAWLAVMSDFQCNLPDDLEASWHAHSEFRTYIATPSGCDATPLFDPKMKSLTFDLRILSNHSVVLLLH